MNVFMCLSSLIWELGKLQMTKNKPWCFGFLPLFHIRSAGLGGSAALSSCPAESLSEWFSFSCGCFQLIFCETLWDLPWSHKALKSRPFLRSFYKLNVKPKHVKKSWHRKKIIRSQPGLLYHHPCFHQLYVRALVVLGSPKRYRNCNKHISAG